LRELDDSFLAARIAIPEQVLFQEVSGHSALLNMDTELYFGLDEVGTRVWKSLQDNDTIAAAAERIAKLYGVPLDQVRIDVFELVGELEQHGLVEIRG
jgi:hypothetical protein